MRDIIGVDLGTTSARVAIMSGDSPVILENSEGEGTTPCYVAILEDGTPLVGEAARRHALRDPTNVAYAVKRLIGRRYDDPVISKLRHFMPYKIVEGTNGDACVELRGKQYSPTLLSGYILHKMKATAEAHIGKNVSHAVVTVPANFTETQRQATKEAGQIAGLDILRIINEPTSAALAYGLGQEEYNATVVYDLGGGTFDVSILEIEYGVTEVLATSGDMMLGGEDFDYVFAQHLAEVFMKSNGVNLLDNPLARLRLKQAAEEAKIVLSHSAIASIDLPFIATERNRPLHFNSEVTRDDFERLIGPLVDRSITVCAEAGKDVSFQNDAAVDSVVLVGGSTRIPLVRNKVEQHYGIKPFGKLRREDAVALGAAIQAGVLSGDVKDCVLLDITSKSVGIAINDSNEEQQLIGIGDDSASEERVPIFCRMIDRYTTIPTKKSQTFSTLYDNQTSILIRIYQGEQELAEQNTNIGEFILTRIPPGPKGMPQIEVTFDIDVNGLLTVSAKDKGTGKSHSIDIIFEGTLGEDELQKLNSDIFQKALPERELSSAIQYKNTLPVSPRTAVDEPPAQYVNFASTVANKKAKIFVSYAHEDSVWAQRTMKALSLLKRSKKAEVWIDRDLSAGDKWKMEISKAISKSNVALLLLSNDFFCSDFILDTELPMIFAERERRKLSLFPLLVRPCAFEQHNELKEFQLFNSPDKSLASLDDWKAEEELSRLAREIATPLL